jgi:NitT/TauT family transport system substrate-binding protein
VTVLGYPALGVNTQGLAIVAAQDTIQKNPDLVRRFIRATRAAFELAAQDPEASIAAGMAEKSDMDRGLALAQLKAGMALMKSPHGPDRPVGWMAAKDWADTLQLMKDYQDLKTDQPASAFWTDEYLPK